MANLFKKFGDYGLAGVSGKVEEIDNNIAIVSAHTYNKDNKVWDKITCAVDMSKTGGTMGIDKGMNLTVIGQMQGQNEKGQVKIDANVADLGNCRITYGGYGIVSGEATYKVRPNQKTQEPNLEVTFKTKDKDTEQTVYNHVKITPYKGDTSSMDRMTKKLTQAANDCKLQLKPGCDQIYERYPFDSAFAFKVNEKYEEPRASTYNDVTYLHRSNFALGPTVYNIGFPMMNKIREAIQQTMEYNEQRGQKAPEVQDPQEERQEQSAPAMEEHAADGEELPFDDFEMDYTA